MEIGETKTIKGPIPSLSPGSLKESYKKIMGNRIANAQAEAEAAEELWAEDWKKKNPFGGMDQARAAYANRPGSLTNPVKAPDSNSPEIKFGARRRM
jgi:hypothetical protein